MWIEAVGTNSKLLSTTSAAANNVVSQIEFVGDSLFIAKNGTNGEALHKWEFSTNNVYHYSAGGVYVAEAGISGRNDTDSDDLIFD